MTLTHLPPCSYTSLSYAYSSQKLPVMAEHLATRSSSWKHDCQSIVIPTSPSALDSSALSLTAVAFSALSAGSMLVVPSAIEVIWIWHMSVCKDSKGHCIVHARLTRGTTTCTREWQGVLQHACKDKGCCIMPVRMTRGTAICPWEQWEMLQHAYKDDKGCHIVPARTMRGATICTWG
jgi:hypothetical protein